MAWDLARLCLETRNWPNLSESISAERFDLALPSSEKGEQSSDKLSIHQSRTRPTIRGEVCGAGNFSAFSCVITLRRNSMNEHNAPTRTPINPFSERILRWISGSGRGQAFGRLLSRVIALPQL